MIKKLKSQKRNNMPTPKLTVYGRICRNCDKPYQTSRTHSQYCGACKIKRRKKKIPTQKEIEEKLDDAIKKAKSEKAEEEFEEYLHGE